MELLLGSMKDRLVQHWVYERAILKDSYLVVLLVSV